MLKRLKYLVLINLLPGAIYLFLLALGVSFRIRHVNKDGIDRLYRERRSAIVCFWHGRLLAMPFAHEKRPASVLISRHGDGEFITRVIKHFGFGAVRGSYKKASVSSLREIISELRKGTTIGVTPDGPKGPRYEVKPGIVELARMAGSPIVPLTYGASSKRTLGSWDRLVFPFPFSRILFLWGDPIYVSPDASADTIEKTRKELEERLASLTEAADRMACGD